ncbi:MAG: AAA family ATPase [Candidatus Colwellbacteria bacterium]|nr:AAA family ATPase [Candidatus Colwellbacteria bacterium]
MSNDDGHITPFSTLVTILLSKKYTLDMSTYGALLAVNTLVIKYILSDSMKEKLSNFSFIEWLTVTNIVAVAVFVYCIFLANRHRHYVKVYAYRMIGQKKEIVKYRILTINSYDDAKLYIEYAEKYPEFFEKPKEINIGILSYDRTGETNRSLIYSNDRRVANGNKVKFSDKNFNVDGYYIWKRHEMVVGSVKETGKDIVKSMNCIELYVDEKSCTDLLKYFKDIEELVVKKRSENRLVETYYIRFTGLPKVKADEEASKHIVANEYYSIYDGARKSVEELEKQYLDTFFSPSKKIIWPIVKQIHVNPMKFFEMGQSPQSGWLIYGPPGTGKSSFVYRVAMCLQRHVVSIDIRGMKKRSAIFAAMRKPYINKTTYTEPCNVVYLFDEIDLALVELYNREKKRQKVTEDWMKIMKNSSVIKKREMSSDSSDIIKDDYKDVSLETMMGDSGDDMTSHDLLEFFQGPIPYKGAIFMATTNKFEEIKRMCPALVRPGRLTPIEFGNPDSATVKEISQFHFGKEVDISDDYSPTISSSQIMQYVLDAKMSDDKGYDHFVKCVKSNVGVNNKKISVRDANESE